MVVDEIEQAKAALEPSALDQLALVAQPVAVLHRERA
jgi:hypothetical protein